jgi:hypothetical protein
MQSTLAVICLPLAVATSVARDDMGRVMCSTKPGGGAAIDSYGKVKCLGECEEGTPQRCEVAR